MGMFEEAKGRLKRAIGDLTGDPKVQREGEAQSQKGRAEREAAEARASGRDQEIRAQKYEDEQRAAERQR